MSAEIEPKRVGRTVGGLLLLQFAGLLVGFMLLAPAVTSEYLGVAAGMETAVRGGTIILLITVVSSLLISVAAFPFFRAQNQTFAICFVALSVIWIVLQALDNAQILSMLSLSKRFADAGAGANSDLYNILAAHARSTRVWGHYTTLLAIDVWLASLYGALLAYRLVPWLVVAIALLTVALHAIGLPLAMFIGYPLIVNLAYGLPVSYLLVGGWLSARGFSTGV